MYVKKTVVTRVQGIVTILVIEIYLLKTITNLHQAKTN